MNIRQFFSQLSQKLRPVEKKCPWILHYPAGLEWDAEILPKPLTALLLDAEKRFPGHVAVDFLGKTYTYEEIAISARAVAAGLQQLGIGKGSKVGLFLPNSPHFIISYYAILLAGGTVVNFNPLYPVRDVKAQIEDARVEVMITFALTSLLGKLQGCHVRTLITADFADALPFPKNVLFPLVKRKEILPVPSGEGHIAFRTLLEYDPATLCPVEIEPEDDIAVLQYTGGTTGQPKGAMLTHANLYANTIQCGMWCTVLDDGAERILGALPCFHVFAMTAVMNLGIHKGMRIILHPQFDLKTVLKDISKKRPTIMPGVPTIFNAINNYPKLGAYNLTSLKMCISGGAGLPKEVKERFEEMTGCKLVEGYGLSESSPVATVNPLFGVNKPGSIGMPLPGTLVEVVSTGFFHRALPVGKIGEICIRGPQVMKGYWNRPNETDAVLKDGRLHTGDIGYMDADGYFFIIDRLKEMIISGGYNIYPRNIEEVIYMHEAVREAAVIGVADAHWGQRVKAFVVVKEGHILTEDALTTFLRDKLPRFALPSEIEFRDTLPKTMIGKIAKKEL